MEGPRSGRHGRDRPRRPDGVHAADVGARQRHFARRATVRTGVPARTARPADIERDVERHQAGAPPARSNRPHDGGRRHAPFARQQVSRDVGDGGAIQVPLMAATVAPQPHRPAIGADLSGGVGKPEPGATGGTGKRGLDGPAGRFSAVHGILRLSAAGPGTGEAAARGETADRAQTHVSLRPRASRSQDETGRIAWSPMHVSARWASRTDPRTSSAGRRCRASAVHPPPAASCRRSVR